MDSSSKGRVVLAEHYRKVGALSNKRFDSELERDINASAQANIQSSKREDGGSNEMQRVFTREGVKECAAEPNNKKIVGEDEIVNEISKYGGEGMIIMMAMLYKWMWGNEYTPKR